MSSNIVLNSSTCILFVKVFPIMLTSYIVSNFLFLQVLINEVIKFTFCWRKTFENTNQCM